MRCREAIGVWRVALAVVYLCVLGPLTSNAAGQVVEIVDDTRFVRTMGSDSGMMLRYWDTQHATFGQDFNGAAGHVGQHGYAAGTHTWQLSANDSSFELDLALWGEAYLNELGPGIQETHYADMVIDVWLANDVPIAYEVVAELSSAGQAHVYFRGLEMQEVAPGVFVGSGVLEPGVHRLESWGYASTMLEALNDPDQLLDPSVLVEGGWMSAQVSVRGRAMTSGHIVPSPAAAGPGMLILGMMLLWRRRHAPGMRAVSAT